MADYQEEILNELRRIGNEISSLNRKMNRFVPAPETDEPEPTDELQPEEDSAAPEPPPKDEKEIAFCISCGKQIVPGASLFCDECEKYRSSPESSQDSDTPDSTDPPPAEDSEEPEEEPEISPEEDESGTEEEDASIDEEEPEPVFSAGPDQFYYRSLIDEEPEDDKPEDEEVRDEETKDTVTEPQPEPVAAAGIKTSFRETEIGMKWFGLAGIVLVVVAFAFFVKLAIDNEWIGPATRVAGGVVLGLIFVIGGKWFDTKEQFKGYARTLIGGGFAILYLIIYAAHHLYGDEVGISKSVDIILLTIVVGAAIVFSISLDAMVLAAEAFLLGYATAYMCGNINEHTLYYNIVLAAGLIYLVYRKGWLAIGCTGLAATYVFHCIWLSQNPYHPVINLVMMFIYMLLFVGLGLAQKNYLLHAEPDKTHEDLSPLPAETRIIFYCVAFLSLVIPIFGVSATPDAGGANAFFAYYIMVGIALLVLSIMFSLSWAALAANLASYIAFIVLNDSVLDLPSNTSTAFLVTTYILFSSYTFIAGTRDRKKVFEPSITVLLNTFFFFGLLFYKIFSDYRSFAGLFALVLAVSSLVQCALASKKDLKHLFKLHLVFTVMFVTLAVPVQLTKQWLPVSWAAEAFALLYVSFVLKDELLKRLSQLVAVIAVGAMFRYVGEPQLRTVALLVSAASFFASAGLFHKQRSEDTAVTETFIETMIYGLVGWMAVNLFLWHAFPYPGLHAVLFCLWGIALLSAVSFMRLYWLAPTPFLTHIFLLLYSISSVGNDKSLALAMLGPQVVGYLACYLILRKSDFGDELIYLKRPGLAYSIASGLILTVLLALVFKGHLLSIAWGTEAVVLLVIGVGDKNKFVRYSGMGLLGLTLAKVVVSDMAYLDMGYRVISFFGLGLIFLLASFLYYKFKDRIEELL